MHPQLLPSKWDLKQAALIWEVVESSRLNLMDLSQENPDRHLDDSKRDTESSNSVAI